MLDGEKILKNQERKKVLLSEASKLDLNEETTRKLENIIRANADRAIDDKSYEKSFNELGEIVNTIKLGDIAQKNVVYSLKELFPSFLTNGESFRMFQDLVDIKQKGIGAAEVFLCFLFSGVSFSEGKTGDLKIQIGPNKVLEAEVKYTKSAASIKATPDASRRCTDKLWKEYFGKKERGTLRQLFEASEAGFHSFMGKVYDFYEYKRFEEIRTAKNHNDKDKKHYRAQRQELGYDILKRYHEIDGFDVLIALAPDEKNLDFKLVIVRDFNDKEFILNNFQFTPCLYRGKGTQALGDGYADLEVKV